MPEPKRDIAKDRAMCEAATKGPWQYDGQHNEIVTPYGDKYWLIVSECRSAPDQDYPHDQFGHHYDANFAFIAGARDALPHYLTRTAEAESKVATVEAELDLNTKLLAGVVKERDHNARMVDAAVDLIDEVKMECPVSLELFGTPEDCENCLCGSEQSMKKWRDYLDQKAKEEER